MHDDAQLRLLAEDAAARSQALDVTQSFLVQAPAGSGKTELLIQRYLALLARVQAPEQIVALTFTRKAAGEMRERLVKALLDAHQQRAPVELHERQTYALARAAIAQDQRCGWELAEHASRLKMVTFDALATDFAARAPLAAGLGPHPGYVDDAMPLYRAAAQAVVERAGAGDLHWRKLLLHLDNNAPRVADLVAALLQKRDQWLRAVTGTPPAELRAGLERALRAEIVDVLQATRRAFPAGIDLKICARANDAAAYFAELGQAGELAEAVALCSRGGLPEASVEALPHWRALARFLMVKACTHFKAMITRNDGFPPGAGSPGALARRERKAAMESLCQTLNATPGLTDALAAASRLPDPALGDAAWRLVEALLHILRSAAAELTTVFAALGKADFVQANLAALDALGAADAPTDLLLRLDASVQHLLVDEFQDTSFTQLEMLRRLTAGWQPDDGRTLFAVGDPMQSIYRFREAEVRLFVEARAGNAIAALPVRTLRLRRNFRAQANLVAWTNATFEPVLGAVSDPARGAVQFEPATAVRDAVAGVHPTLDLGASRQDEALHVVERIRAAQAAGASSIAVLVRARAHLTALLPALREARVTFAAVELDRLSQRQAVIDVCALAHAILQPADRRAWLGVLRAPWCGLTLVDLFAVVGATGNERRAPLLPVLESHADIPGLSPEGRRRLDRTLDVLRPAIAARGRASVADRVKGAWLALGGPATLDDPLDLDATSLAFDLLDEHDAGGDLPEWDALLGALDGLHATPQAAASTSVQVMTMHKAKGLEFDTVILPGLAADPKRGDGPILRWRRRATGLLVAPGKAQGGEAEPLYDYLGALDKQEDDAELGRLLYVACTRAKTRLHLVAALATETRSSGELAWKKPAKASSLAKLWPALASSVPPPTRESQTIDKRNGVSRLMRLPVDYRPTLGMVPGVDPMASARGPGPVTPPFDWARETTRRIGTLAHRLLARIADEGLAAWPAARVAELAPRVRAELTSSGFAADELAAATRHVLDAVQRTLNDPRGRWLFDPSHAHAHSEWALSGLDAGELVHVVVDRTFVSGGERWIIDFKTGTHEGGDAAAFLDHEVERYREQLTRYGRMVQGLDPRPVRLALYYPMIPSGFREL